MLQIATPEYLQKNARMLVYAAAFIIACAAWLMYAKGFEVTPGASSAFGFLAFSFISLALAASPIRALFPAWRYNAAYYMARRALGVSGFVFAFLHYAAHPILYFNGDFAFFLSATGDYALWVWAGVAALAALFLLAATSTDWAVGKMGRRWFALQKLVYLAYPLIIAHAYSIGANFSGRGMNLFSGAFLAIAAATVLLEAARAYAVFRKKETASG
ncbi:MAG: ferric reductase-like transmembrane domain-containing protein [Candidatus Micrarchaeia archaeon]|jgi:sulfoxide reductase heme-binding subunit YedZ